MIGETEQPECAHQDAIPRPTSCQSSQNRRSQAIGQRENGDQLADQSLAHPSLVRDHGEHSGDEEGIGSQGKHAQGQQDDARVDVCEGLLPFSG